jgi:DNA-binding transcriptional regulator LsrR (DeoR family)
MPKLDRRRSREHRQRGAIFALHARGCNVEEISRKSGASPRKVEKVLDAAGVRDLVSVEVQQTHEEVRK